MEIDVEKEKAKYQAQLDAFARHLQELDQQRLTLIQAIQERRGIVAFLDSFKEIVSREKEV